MLFRSPARKYTKYISWDILITIACAFAISKAMVNSGVADSVAKFIIGLSDDMVRMCCSQWYLLSRTCLRN